MLEMPAAPAGPDERECRRNGGRRARAGGAYSVFRQCCRSPEAALTPPFYGPFQGRSIPAGWTLRLHIEALAFDVWPSERSMLPDVHRRTPIGVSTCPGWGRKSGPLSPLARDRERSWERCAPARATLHQPVRTPMGQSATPRLRPSLPGRCVRPMKLTRSGERGARFRANRMKIGYGGLKRDAVAADSE